MRSPMQDRRRNRNATHDGYRRGVLQCYLVVRLVLRVLGSLVDGVARRADIFTNTFNCVAGGGGRREQKSESCKSRLHQYLHVPSANHGRVP